jgi:glycosyltransferase involved in cell wall biosynthesis
MTAQITVVIPDYNEEGALPQTLAALALALKEYDSSGLGQAEVVVVDNASTDASAAVAVAAGARVIAEPKRGIATARNTGAGAASAPWLFFLDADTQVAPDVLVAIHGALADPLCFGGAPATRYDYRKRVLRPYMAMWKVVARVRGMTQGVGQFATAEAFRDVGGYPEELAMAEDTEFYWRLTRLARRHGAHTTYLAGTVIVPSSRRYDEWPAWKTILMTNPITTRMFLRSRRFWAAWGERSVR